MGWDGGILLGWGTPTSIYLPAADQAAGPSREGTDPKPVPLEKTPGLGSPLTRQGRKLSCLHVAPTCQEMMRKGCSQEPPGLVPRASATGQVRGGSCCYGERNAGGQAENTTERKQGRPLFPERPCWNPPSQQGAVERTSLLSWV